MKGAEGSAGVAWGGGVTPSLKVMGRDGGHGKMPTVGSEAGGSFKRVKGKDLEPGSERRPEVKPWVRSCSGRGAPRGRTAEGGTGQR